MNELGFPRDTSGKEPNCQCWRGRSPGGGNGNPPPIFLPRESPWTEETGGLQPIVLHRIRREWSNLAHTHTAWIKDEITKKIRRYFKLNDKEYTEYQSLWDTARCA